MKELMDEASGDNISGVYLSVLRRGNDGNSIYIGNGNKCKFDNGNE